jgi:hypothetical protein
MPRDVTKKVKTRAEKVARLLRRHGCITIRVAMERVFSKTQAEVALRHLTERGRAVRVQVGRLVFWCYSKRSAVKHLRRLKQALHGALCTDGAKRKYVSPGEALEAIMRDAEARRLFTRYIPLAPSGNTLNAVKSLLELAYGKPVHVLHGGRHPLFFVDCGRKPRPLPPFLYKEKRQYRSVPVKLEPELLEAVKRLAEAEGVSVSAVVRRAVERLLELYRETVPIIIKAEPELYNAIISATAMLDMPKSTIATKAIEQLLEQYRRLL